MSEKQQSGREHNGYLTPVTGLPSTPKSRLHVHLESEGVGLAQGTFFFSHNLSYSSIFESIRSAMGRESKSFTRAAELYAGLLPATVVLGCSSLWFCLGRQQESIAIIHRLLVGLSLGFG